LRRGGREVERREGKTIGNAEERRKKRGRGFIQALFTHFKPWLHQLSLLELHHAGMPRINATAKSVLLEGMMERTESRYLDKNMFTAMFLKPRRDGK